MAAVVDVTTDVAFHNVDYILTVQVLSASQGEKSDAGRSATLVVEIEEKSSGDRWKGEFSSRYVEDVTHKTGNFKRFSVFVKMLVTSLQQESDSVFVDLLTFQDLEVLRARKQSGEAGGALNASTSSWAGGSHGGAANRNRYLILTYLVEFDRVHYPLPLVFEEHPDPHVLQGIIRKLRAELDEARASAANASAAAARKLPDDLDLQMLLEESQVLRNKIQRLESENRKAAREEHTSPEFDELLGECERLRAQQADADAEFEAERMEYDAEIKALQRELHAERKETDELRRANQDLRERTDSTAEHVRQLRTVQRQAATLQDELEKERQRSKRMALKHRQETARLSDELSKVKSMERQLRIQNRQLNAEVSRSLSRPRSGSTGRARSVTPDRGSARARSPSPMSQRGRSAAANHVAQRERARQLRERRSGAPAGKSSVPRTRSPSPAGRRSPRDYDRPWLANSRPVSRPRSSSVDSVGSAGSRASSTRRPSAASSPASARGARAGNARRQQPARSKTDGARLATRRTPPPASGPGRRGASLSNRTTPERGPVVRRRRELGQYFGDSSGDEGGASEDEQAALRRAADRLSRGGSPARASSSSAANKSLNESREPLWARVSELDPDRGHSGAPSGGQLTGNQEIADIDARLRALQQILSSAKQ